MQVIKVMFFDLDGTLCSTDEANFGAYAKALADEGFEFRREDFPKTNGLSSTEFLPIVASGITPDAVQRVNQLKAKYYPDFMHMVKPNDELISFIRVMRGHNTMVLVTTAKRANGLHVLKAVGLLDAFDYMVFGDEVEHMKPHPEAYLKALAVSGTSPEDGIAFEDSDAGVRAANAAGLRVIKVLDNHAV